MVAKKRKIKKRNSQNKELLEMKQTLKKKEFWIGLVTLLVFAFIAVRVVFPRANPFSQKQTNNVPQPIVTKSVPCVYKEDGKKQEPTKQVIEEVAPAENNTGPYIVQKGDSYYKISLNVCGTGKYFESISYQNGGKSLYEGDAVYVLCVE